MRVSTGKEFPVEADYKGGFAALRWKTAGVGPDVEHSRAGWERPQHLIHASLSDLYDPPLLAGLPGRQHDLIDAVNIFERQAHGLAVVHRIQKIQEQ